MQSRDWPANGIMNISASIPETVLFVAPPPLAVQPGLVFMAAFSFRAEHWKTSNKLSQIQSSDGGVWGGKLDCFVYFKSFPLALVGISERDLNLFIIFEGISPIGPCE